MPRFAYQKRAFLHPPSAGKNSYICAVAESSENGDYALGNYFIVLADCHKAVELEFPLNNPHERKQSLAKIELLADTLIRFRHALRAEAKAIESARKP